MQQRDIQDDSSTNCKVDHLENMSTLSRETSFFGEKKKKKSVLNLKIFSKKKSKKNDLTEETIHPEELSEKEKLYQAILELNCNEVKRLLTISNVDCEFENDMRPQDLAAAFGNIELLELTLQNCCQINVPNKSKKVALHYAMESNEMYKTVDFLLQHEADINIMLPNNDFPIHKACSEADTDLLELLLSYNPNIENQDAKGFTAIHRACLNDFNKHVEVLLPICTNLINDNQNEEGKTLLHIAILNHNVELMNLLLDHNAKINIEMKNGKTAIDLLTNNVGSTMYKTFFSHIEDKYFEKTKSNSMEELAAKDEFAQFLLFLKDFPTNKNIPATTRAQFQENIDEIAAVNDLFELDEENIEDFLQFETAITKALVTDEIKKYKNNKEIITTISIYTTKYILLREDVKMLQTLMQNTEIWENVHDFLIDHIDVIYSKISSKMGPISKLFVREFIMSDATMGIKRRLNRQMLADKMGNSLKLQSLKSECCKQPLVQNIIDSYMTWSILTGKFNLTCAFLKEEEFLILPMCIIATGLVRNMHKMYNFKDKKAITSNNLAKKIEQFACNVVKNTLQFDISNQNETTYSFLLQPLPSFSNLNCINIAANCQCDELLRLPICQKAMDVAWYKYLHKINVFWREFIIIIGVIPFNPLLPLILAFLSKDDSKSSNNNMMAIETSQPGLDESKIDLKMLDKGSTNDMELEEGNVRENLLPEVKTRKSFHSLKQYFLYYQIPAIKFRYFAISQIILTMVLSYVLLTDFNYEIKPIEVFVYITTLGFIVEEVKEIVTSTTNKDFSSYLSNKWNAIDLMMCLFVAAGFTLRMVCMYTYKPIHSTFENQFEDKLWYGARVFLSVSCLCMWVKLLQILRVHRFFGPKLKMIYMMIIQDLIPFLFILFIYIFGFGVFMYSLLYPNGYYAYNNKRQNLASILKSIVHICFYSIFGEYHLETLTGIDCEQVYQLKQNNSMACPHPDSIYIIPYLFLPIYIIITTILLLSLIVAMFSKTIEQVDSNSKADWQFERFAIIDEYQNCSALPPPLNLLDVLRVLAIKMCKNMIPRLKERTKADFYNQSNVVKYLLTQSIALRDCKQKLLESAGETTNTNIVN